MFLVLELCKGGELLTLLKAKGHFTEQVHHCVEFTSDFSVYYCKVDNFLFAMSQYSYHVFGL